MNDWTNLTSFRHASLLQAEQFTDCRIDHYQTPSEVHVSVFAKQVDQERSTVKIETNQVRA